jgi:antitoxin HicB
MRKTNSRKEKIYQYTAVFEKNEKGGYTVTVPVLPGLVTEGRDLEKARYMVQDAVKCYIQGLKKLNETIPTEEEVGNFRLTIRA